MPAHWDAPILNTALGLLLYKETRLVHWGLRCPWRENRAPRPQPAPLTRHVEAAILAFPPVVQCECVNEPRGDQGFSQMADPQNHVTEIVISSQYVWDGLSHSNG